MTSGHPGSAAVRRGLVEIPIHSHSNGHRCDCIAVVYDRFSSRTRLRCDVVTSLLAIVYFVAFAWFAFNMARLSVTDWEVGGSAWAQPTPVVVKVAMVLGAALMIVQMISNIRGDLKSLRAKA
jgi:TRAP-type C4-dicarboxylate transport system permease small subunit